MARIAKQFSFSAGHALVHLPMDHKCSRLHGHNYTVELILEGPMNSEGWVVDYGELSEFKKYLDDMIDHRFLASGREKFLSLLRPEEIAWMHGPTTAEFLAEFFFRVCVELFWWQSYLVGVRISETPKTWAEYWRKAND